jgi:hypothetical protein
MDNFIYFVDLDNPALCWTLAKTNILLTASLVKLPGFPEEYSLYSTDPDKFLTDCECLKFGVIAPRLEFILLSCWHRNGLAIGIGQINTRWFTSTEINRINKIAELEVEFEKMRRIVDINLPSRLACIFLAEDNFEGRVMLQNMFSNKINFKIVPVKITVSNRLFKADSKWIGEYEKTGNKQLIENYWHGEDFDNKPQYEFLLEGQIELKQSGDREYIETYGAKT